MIAGYTIQEVCPRSFLDWLFEEAPAPEGSDRFSWVLAHCDDGVMWGRRSKSNDLEGGQWIFSRPVLGPHLERTLQQLRIFGDDTEVLIWNVDGRLVGRRISDSFTAELPLTPSIETQILRGDRVIRDGNIPRGFTQVRDGGGSEQILPLDIMENASGILPFRLIVKHYYEQSTDTGIVRVAASRLVKLTAKEEEQHAG